MDENLPIRFPKRRDTFIDRVIAFETDETGSIKLEENDEKIYKIIKYAHDLILDSLPDKEIVLRLSAKYENKIAKSTLYRHVTLARTVFSYRNFIDVELEKKAWLEENKRFYLAIRDTHPAAAVKLLEQRAKYLKFNQEVKDINPDQYGNHKYYLVIGNTQINIGSAETLKKDDIERIVETIDAEFTEIESKTLEKYVDSGGKR